MDNSPFFIVKKRTTTDDIITPKKKNARSKIKETSQTETSNQDTLENKHRQIIKNITTKISRKDIINEEIEEINKTLDNDLPLSDKLLLLEKKDKLELESDLIDQNYNTMDYYDNTGDLLSAYYRKRNTDDTAQKGSKSIFDYLNMSSNEEIFIKKDDPPQQTDKIKLYEKYCYRLGTINLVEDINKRIKICLSCSIEKILDTGESAYICPVCGDSETIILDENKQVKDYSPYKRLNHFREWLNQFQAKQSPNIPEEDFIEIVKLLNKKKITDLSTLKPKYVKDNILKKLEYNQYYEHCVYIIYKLNNLPPPKITKDMEKLFISMFFQIQTPWELYKPPLRKNFISYPYILYKFCELLELDHLLQFFSLHKDSDKIMETDETWEKICKYLQWEFISSFK
jgi:predicted RNA-binding Zn-ribbon protein involved in translation (DUF1610 family)